MLIEKRRIPKISPGRENQSFSKIIKSASSFVEQSLQKAQLQKQLGYTDAIMNDFLPTTTSYYLFWKGTKLLTLSKKSSATQPTANLYVIAAMRVYPAIVEEIAIEKTYKNPLNASNPHDVAVCLGERLAGLEAASVDEVTIRRRLKADVEKIKRVAIMQRRQQKLSQSA